MARRDPQEWLVDLVEQVFRQQGFETKRSVGVGPNRYLVILDLVATWLEGQIKTVIEVKAFRSRTPSPEDLVLIYQVALGGKETLEADHAVVATNLRRDQLPPRQGLLQDAMILCIEDLIWLACGRVDLISDLVGADRELSSALRDFDVPLPIADPKEAPRLDRLRLNIVTAGAKRAPDRPASLSKGEAIALDLEAIPPGTGAKTMLPSGEENVPWRLLEIVGRRALEYVFDERFHSWDEQKLVGGDDQRFDVLAKVKGTDVFSSMLVQDFRSRYVLFEFKNYEEGLKQNVIFVTEKYLFPTALRSTAFIISPRGLFPQATAATHGSLRDAGKLILDLTVPKLCELLRDRDNGTRPDLKMEQMLDHFLRQVGR